MISGDRRSPAYRALIRSHTRSRFHTYASRPPAFLRAPRHIQWSFAANSWRDHLTKPACASAERTAGVCGACCVSPCVPEERPIMHSAPLWSRTGLT